MQTMALQHQQQNATTTSPRREAHLRKLSRDLLAVSARNLKKVRLGEKENTVSKPSRSIEFAVAPKPPANIQFAADLTLENDKVASCSEIEQTTSPTKEALIRRLSRNLLAVSTMNLVKSQLGEKNKAVSKPKPSGIIVCSCNCGCCAV
jgi:hypothetical protein